MSSLQIRIIELSLSEFSNSVTLFINNVTRTNNFYSLNSFKYKDQIRLFNSIRILTSISTKFTSNIIISILKWREEYLKTLSERSSNELSTKKGVFNEKQCSYCQKKNLLEFVFTKIIKKLLVSRKTGVSPRVMDQIISLIISSYVEVDQMLRDEPFIQTKNEKSQTILILHSNLEITLGKYSKLISLLSSTHLKLIGNKLFGLLNKSEVAKDRLGYLRSFQFINLDVSTPNGLEISTHFLTVIKNFFVKLKSNKKERYLFALSVSKLLKRPALLQRFENLDYTLWYHNVKPFETISNELLKSKKENESGLHLYTSILCVSDSKELVTKFPDYLKLIQKFLNDKGKKRIDGIECFTNICEIYLRITSVRNSQQKTIHLLKPILEKIYPFKKKKSNFIFDKLSLNCLEKLIYILANWDFNFVMDNIIFKVIPPERTNLPQERLLLGLNLLVSILIDNKIDYLLSLPIEKYLDNIIMIVEQNLIQINKNYGSNLLFSQARNRSRSMNESEQKKELYSSLILQSLLKLIPILFPIPSNICEILSRYTLHCDPNINNLSEKIIIYIIENISSLRIQNIIKLTEILLLIPYQNTQLIINTLKKIGNFYQIYLNYLINKKLDFQKKNNTQNNHNYQNNISANSNIKGNKNTNSNNGQDNNNENENIKKQKNQNQNENENNNLSNMGKMKTKNKKIINMIDNKLLKIRKKFLKSYKIEEFNIVKCETILILFICDFNLKIRTQSFLALKTLYKIQKELNLTNKNNTSFMKLLKSIENNKINSLIGIPLEDPLKFKWLVYNEKNSIIQLIKELKKLKELKHKVNNNSNRSNNLNIHSQSINTLNNNQSMNIDNIDMNNSQNSLINNNNNYNNRNKGKSKKIIKIKKPNRLHGTNKIQFLVSDFYSTIRNYTRINPNLAILLFDLSQQGIEKLNLFNLKNYGEIEIIRNYTNKMEKWKNFSSIIISSIHPKHFEKPVLLNKFQEMIDLLSEEINGNTNSKRKQSKIAIYALSNLNSTALEFLIPFLNDYLDKILKKKNQRAIVFIFAPI